MKLHLSNTVSNKQSWISATYIFILILWYQHATGGVDFDSGPYIVIFPAEMTNISLNISITDDTSLEMNETFIVSINSSNDALPVDPDEALVTIVDDDSE